MAKTKKGKKKVHKFTLRCDTDMFKETKSKAEYFGLSINQYVTRALKAENSQYIVPN